MVQNSVKSSGTSLFDQSTLKTVVKNVVAKEDRSRNLMIFGLEEVADEQINEKVGQVLLELGEKPQLEACRLGKKCSSGEQKARPVKVSVSNSLIVKQILQKTRNLRSSDSFKSVFIRADRSAAERSKHRDLIQQMLKKKVVEPDKTHYIRNGQLLSSNKNTDNVN